MSQPALENLVRIGQLKAEPPLSYAGMVSYLGEDDIVRFEDVYGR